MGSRFNSGAAPATVTDDESSNATARTLTSHMR